MTNELVCWKCGAGLGELTLPLRRLEECPECSAELHVCKMCELYDPHVAKSCREPIADEVKEKERANFCDYFSPRPDAYTPREEAAARAALSELEALFGPEAGTEAGSDPDDALRQAQDLFGKGETGK